jgi:hypothetical protein
VSSRGRQVARTLAAVVAFAVVVGSALLALGRGERPASGPGRTDATRPVAASVAPRLDGEVLDTIGVVSENALRHLSYRRAAQDWARITSNPDVDLIGWQESKSPDFRAIYPTYRERGWDTWHYPDPDGPISLAITWRTAVFDLEDVRFEKMHDGGWPRQTTDPFPVRWVVVARLRHLPSGRMVTLLNTHVNHHVETGHRFQHNLNARYAKRHLAALAGLWNTVATEPDKVVVGTGDYNFDHADDARWRPRGGITRTFRGEAVRRTTRSGVGACGPRATPAGSTTSSWRPGRCVRRGPRAQLSSPVTGRCRGSTPTTGRSWPGFACTAETRLIGRGQWSEFIPILRRALDGESRRV